MHGGTSQKIKYQKKTINYNWLMKGVLKIEKRGTPYIKRECF